MNSLDNLNNFIGLSKKDDDIISKCRSTMNNLTNFRGLSKKENVNSLDNQNNYPGLSKKDDDIISKCRSTMNNLTNFKGFSKKDNVLIYKSGSIISLHSNNKEKMNNFFQFMKPSNMISKA